MFESHRNFLANEREPPSSFSLPHLLPSPISLLIFSISPISPSSFSLPLLLLSSYLFPLLSPSELYFGFYDLNRPVARRIFISYFGEIFISIFKNRTDEELGERRTDGGTDGWTHCGRRTNRWAYKGVKDGRIDRRTTNDEVDGRTERLTVGRTDETITILQYAKDMIGRKKGEAERQTERTTAEWTDYLWNRESAIDTEIQSAKIDCSHC